MEVFNYKFVRNIVFVGAILLPNYCLEIVAIIMLFFYFLWLYNVVVEHENALMDIRGVLLVEAVVVCGVFKYIKQNSLFMLGGSFLFGVLACSALVLFLKYLSREEKVIVCLMSTYLGAIFMNYIQWYHYLLFIINGLAHAAVLMGCIHQYAGININLMF